MTDTVDSRKPWLTPFAIFWGGQSFSLLGSQLVQFALIWWLTQKTGSATILTTASLVGLLPQVVLGPLAGALVDRWNRRTVMAWADSLVALFTLVLAGLFWLGEIQIWHVFVLLFLRSLAGGFHWPAMQASTSLMVPKEHLSRVQGMNQVLQGALNIGSAPLGALLLEILPIQGVLGIDVLTAFLAVGSLLIITIPQPETEAGIDGKKNTVGQDLSAGFQYVWAWPGLVMILGMATLINLVLTPAGALEPLLVTKHFGGKAIELAWLQSAWGVGVLIGGLTLSAWGGFKRRIATSMAGLILMGAAMVGIGFAPSSGYWLAVAFFFVAGFSNPIVNGPLLAVVQAVVDPQMQGRVLTLIMSFASMMTPLGLILAGPMADRFGIQVWYLFGGVITGILGISAFFIPHIMNIENGNRNLHPQAITEPNR